MKIVKKANGSKTIKISKAEWESIGKTAGWDDDIDIFDDDDVNDELDEDILKEIKKLEVEVPEDKTAIPQEIKKEKIYKKKDPAEWAAEREERAEKAKREKAKSQQKKYDKFLEKEVYSKPPID